MNILIIPDSFKGCMSSNEVAMVMESAVKRVFTKSKYKLLPFSDGGEGALKLLERYIDGELMNCRVTDPLLRPMEANYFCFKNKTSAWVELSQTAGLNQLTHNEYNPLITSTWGTGKMILDALNQGCNKIYLGIGGSATHDFGSGIISAFNGQFLDKKNKRLISGGGAISQLNRIDLSMIDQRVKKIKFIVACDVSNPLLGNNGAAKTYAEQKGANPQMIDQLEFAGKQFTKVILNQFGIDVGSIKGGGAAGGVSAGLYGLMNAKLKNGFDLLADLIGISDQINEMDLVITGEGNFDNQSMFGKLPFKVAQLTESKKIPTLIMAGQTSINNIPNMPHVKIYKTTPEKIPLEKALKNAPQNLEIKLYEVLKQFNIKKT